MVLQHSGRLPQVELSYIQMHALSPPELQISSSHSCTLQYFLRYLLPPTHRDREIYTSNFDIENTRSYFFWQISETLCVRSMDKPSTWATPLMSMPHNLHDTCSILATASYRPAYLAHIPGGAGLSPTKTGTTPALRAASTSRRLSPIINESARLMLYCLAA